MYNKEGTYYYSSDNPINAYTYNRISSLQAFLEFPKF